MTRIVGDQNLPTVVERSIGNDPECIVFTAQAANPKALDQLKLSSRRSWNS
jgi:hypothetical protein